MFLTLAKRNKPVSVNGDLYDVENYKSYGRLRCHLNQNPFAGDDEGILAALFVLERAGRILSGMNEYSFFNSVHRVR